jgi:manganese/zinc/iron transport system substrate-binding protein
VALLTAASACTDNQVPASVDGAANRLQVVTTTGMIADVASNVGGDRVQVTALMGPGVDPHLYRASEGDITRLAGADVVLYNGLHLEAKMGEVLEQMGDGITSVAVTDAIDDADLLSPPEFEGTHDPHVWFDVDKWRAVSGLVRGTLQGADPEGAAEYSANATAYDRELQALDEYVRAQVELVPSDRRVLITAHDAFHYFGDAYGFEVRGLQGISTATEAGTGDVQDLATFIATRRIPAIFVESSVPVRNIEAVQAGVRAKGWDVRIGGELFSDAMGRPGTPEGTYVGMVTHNVETIVEALLADELAEGSP